MAGPAVPGCTEETEEIEGIKEAEEREALVDVAVLLQDALRCSRMTAPDAYNRVLFDFCRRVRGAEETFLITLEPEQLQRAFDAWARVNQDFLDGSTDHFGQFLVKLNAVRRPFGATLAAALQRAYAEAPPRAALLIRDRDAHVVASLCRALQREAGSEPFFLVSRRCGELIGRAHTLVAQWLRMFQSLHIIELVEKGYQGRGARYFYIADD